MFFNKVSVEAKGVTSEGCVIVIRETADAASDISYEDAWKKAHAVATKIAHQKLEEQLKLANEECNKKAKCLVGERGFPGPRGPAGPTGPAAVADKSLAYYSITSPSSVLIPDYLTNKSSESSKALCPLTRRDVAPFFKYLSVLGAAIFTDGADSTISKTTTAALDTFLNNDITIAAFDTFLISIIEYVPLLCMIEQELIFIIVEPGEYEYTYKVTIGINTSVEVGIKN